MKTFAKNNDFYAICIISFVISFIIFGNTIKGDFIGDDHTVVEGRDELKSLTNLPNFFLISAFPGQTSLGLYRPFTLSSYAFNFFVSKKSSGFHIVNIIIYALNAVVAFFVVFQLTASRRIAWLTALIFLFLPVHTETVAPVVGRSEVLSVFFMLSSLLAFLKKRYFWSSLGFLSALFSKEFSVFLLPVFGTLFLLDIIQDISANKGFNKTSGFFRRIWKNGAIQRSVGYSLYFLPPLVFYFLLRYLTLGKYAFGSPSLNPVTAPIAFFNWKERFFTSFYSFYIYLRDTFYPIYLSPDDYFYNELSPVKNIFSSFGALIGLVLFILMAVFIFKSPRKLKIACILVIVPFVFISNMFFLTGGSLADRWWYFPSLGISMIIAMGINWILSRSEKLKLPLIVIGSIILIWYSYVAVIYGKIWLNDRTFFKATAEKSPNSAWARSNLAAVYLYDKDFEKTWEEARAALKIHPNYVPTLNIVGQLYWNDANFKLAEETFKKAIESDMPAGSNSRGLYRMLAFLNLDFGRNQTAIDYMEKVISSPPPRTNTANVLDVDSKLLEYLKKYRYRDSRTYIQAEGEEMASVIRLVRGF